MFDLIKRFAALEFVEERLRSTLKLWFSAIKRPADFAGEVCVRLTRSVSGFLLPPFFNIRRRSIPRSKKFRHGNFSSFQLYPPCRVGVSLLSLRLCRSLSLPSIAAHPWPSSLPSLPPLSPPPPFSVLESHLAPHHHVITRRNHLLSQSKVVL
jgi:hypothetical protein